MPRNSVREIYDNTQHADFDENLDFVLFSSSGPTHFEEVVKEEKWCKAMYEELDAIERNKPWELTNLPKGK